MTTSQQRNLVLPLTVIVSGLLMFLLAIDVLAPPIADLIQRAWPLWLVIAGFNILLVDRVRFGNWLAVVLSGIILGVIILYGYSVQSNKVREDYQERLEPIPLGDHIQGVNLDMTMLTTTVSIRPMDGNLRGIGATFKGSRESRVSISAQETEQGIVDFIINETRSNQIPNLANIGRGHVEVLLPVGTPLTDLVLSNQSGGIRLDFRGVEVPRFEVDNAFGNIDLYLSSTSSTIAGTIRIEEGNLRILVDPTIPLRIKNAPPNRSLDQNVYASDQGLIETRGGLQNFQHELDLSLPNGELVIITPELAESN